MKILGIDPGLARCGWAVIEEVGGSVKPLAYECIETEVGESSQRLKKIHTQITEIIKKYKPQALSIEELFFNSNSKTAFSVGQARGVAILAAAQKNIPVFSYTPLQVKVAVSGYGKADKAQVSRMIKVILGIKNLPKLDDTTDALAVALTHAFSKNTAYLV